MSKNNSEKQTKIIGHIGPLDRKTEGALRKLASILAEKGEKNPHLVPKGMEPALCRLKENPSDIDLQLLFHAVGLVAERVRDELIAERAQEKI